MGDTRKPSKEFIHVETIVTGITMDGDTCLVRATVSTCLRPRAGFMSGPDIDFTLELPAADLANAYQLAVNRGRQLFAEFNSAQDLEANWS